MDRNALEALSREALIERAAALGVVRPQILTRPELVDELLLREAKKGDRHAESARGFFGRARDLLADVIERGLHLPEAADRIRAISLTAPPPKKPLDAQIPTVTLAEIYAAQGHKERALETLRAVLREEPDHDAATNLLQKLSDPNTRVSAPPLPPEEPEPGSPPAALLDDEPLPPRYDVDECVALSVTPTKAFVYWEIKETTLADARQESPHGTVTLRAITLVPTWEGPRPRIRDVSVHTTLGDWVFTDLPDGAPTRMAIGYKVGDRFWSFAHAAALDAKRTSPSAEVARRFVRFHGAGVHALAGEETRWLLESAIPPDRDERAHAHTGSSFAR